MPLGQMKCLACLSCLAASIMAIWIQLMLTQTLYGEYWANTYD